MIDIHIDKEITIATHSGNFHSDEVFATATVLLALKHAPARIVRTRDQKEIDAADIVLDVGKIYDPENNRYDHHQEEFVEERDNGIPYSSFGLVWKEYGEILCGSAYAARIIDERLVSYVDAGDNGVESYTPASKDLSPYVLHNIKEAFNPTWKEVEEGKSIDDAFNEMVEFAKRILEREIRMAQDIEEGEQYVIEAYKKAEDKRIIILDGHYPWEGVLWKYEEPLFVVKPDVQSDKKWKVKTVRIDPDASFANKKDLPLEWAGKTGSDLAAISGVDDALFCHLKRFIAVANSRHGAIALAKKALDS